MKIIIVSGSNNCPKINILADSALQKTGKPFFVPDFADRFVGSTHVCAHISRLGKNIAKRFSERYYEQVGLCFAGKGRDVSENTRLFAKQCQGRKLLRGGWSELEG